LLSRTAPASLFPPRSFVRSAAAELRWSYPITVCFCFIHSLTQLVRLQHRLNLLFFFLLLHTHTLTARGPSLWLCTVLCNQTDFPFPSVQTASNE
jgi:hypothetical protein